MAELRLADDPENQGEVRPEELSLFEKSYASVFTSSVAGMTHSHVKT